MIMAKLVILVNLMNFLNFSVQVVLVNLGVSCKLGDSGESGDFY